jgi:hypothetical protein
MILMGSAVLADTRDWSAAGPDGGELFLSRTVVMDDYGPFLTLIVNLSPQSAAPSDRKLRQFAEQILQQECATFGGVPSTDRVSPAAQEIINRYVWRGQDRTAWTFIRYCV